MHWTQYFTHRGEVLLGIRGAWLAYSKCQLINASQVANKDVCENISQVVGTINFSEAKTIMSFLHDLLYCSYRVDQMVFNRINALVLTLSVPKDIPIQCQGHKIVPYLFWGYHMDDDLISVIS